MFSTGPRTVQRLLRYYLAPPLIFYAEFDERGFNTCIGRFQSAQHKVETVQETEMVRT